MTQETKPRPKIYIQAQIPFFKPNFQEAYKICVSRVLDIYAPILLHKHLFG